MRPDPKTPEPARLSSSAVFNKNLELALGPMPLGHQRHHIVPDNIVKNNPLYQEAMARGLYDVDRAENGVYLANSAENFVDISKNLPTHNGSHPLYDKAVDAAIKQRVAGKNVMSMTDGEIENLLDAIEEDALDIMENWTNHRLN